MKWFEHYFHGPFAACRAHLLSRVFLIIVALDAWTIMLGHSAKYGYHGFNVAHFAWLDAWIPGDNRALYQAVLLGCGLLSMLATLLGGQRFLVAGAFVLHSLSWSMSMLDSYQHHYFTSLVLLCMALWPTTTATLVHDQPSTPAPESCDRKKRKKSRDRRHAPSPSAGSRPTRRWATAIYVAVMLAIVATIVELDIAEAGPLTAAGLLGTAMIATWLYRPHRIDPLPQARGFGFSLLACTVAIMYAYTATAKLDWDWLEGHTLASLVGKKPTLEPVLTALGELGISTETGWSMFAVATIAIEFGLATAYLLAPIQDRRPFSGLRVALWAAWGVAMALHIGIELVGLRIGWFSYYMLALGCAYLLPMQTVDKLTRLLTWPRLGWRKLPGSPLSTSARADAMVAFVGGSIAVLVLGGSGTWLDLPGAHLFGLVAALGALACIAVVWQRRGARRAAQWSGALTLTACTLVAAVTLSSTRFDFYRRLGQDYVNQGELAAALEAYETAERYAPAGASRRETIERLRLRVRDTQ